MSQNIEKLLQRCVVEVIVKKDLEEKLKSGKKLKVKLGIDPSGADLHIGHMVVIRKLREFQEAGHEIQLLFGNFTGQIGDPTDKLDARKSKTQAELEHNAEKYLEQAGKIIDKKKVKIYWNADWLGKLTFADVVGLSQIFTVQQMLERDMYEERVKKELPIYMHEFLYPLMQGYDSVALKSDLELGGTDQTFNLLAGRTIQKAYNQTPQNVLTVPILVGTDGREKMGKSLNNYIGVNDHPQDMYGKTMSIPDDQILNYFELATDVSIPELKKFKKALQEGENPRNLKMRLARELVTIYHDSPKAIAAEKEFIEIFSNKGIPSDIKLFKLKGQKWNIVEILSSVEMVSSKSDARRLIDGGGVRVDNEKVETSDDMIDISTEKLIQIGKRKFIKVIGQ